MAVRVPRKPAKIIDRDSEWKDLVDLARSGGPELAFVVGRRRVGKSFVLSQFAHRVNGLYYQASSRTENEQLLNLSQVIGETFKDPALQRGVAFPNWDALLDDLTARASSAPLVLVLDEFPYLAAAAPGLTSLVQRHWDHKWPGVPIKLVLSGPHITAMQRLESGDQPLYGRRQLVSVYAVLLQRDVAIPADDFRALREKTAVLTRELKAVTSFKYVLFSRQAPTDPVLLQEIAAGQVAWYDIPALFVTR